MHVLYQELNALASCAKRSMLFFVVVHTTSCKAMTNQPRLSEFALGHVALPSLTSAKHDVLRDVPWAEHGVP